MTKAPRPPRTAEVRRLRLQPGDVVVMQTDRELTAEHGQQLALQLRQVLDAAGHQNVPAILLYDGVELAVVDGASLSLSRGVVEGDPIDGWRTFTPASPPKVSL